MAGDLDAQGNVDELFLRDRETGSWIILGWEPNEFAQAAATQYATSGWLPDWDNFVVGDWDTDGRLDDMFIYDNGNGGWVMMSFHRYQHSYEIVSSYVSGLDIFLSGSFG